MSHDPTGTVLEYGRRPKRRVKPSHVIVPLLVVAAVSFAAWSVPRAINWWKAWQRQRQIAAAFVQTRAYAPPPDVVVFDDEPTRAGALIANKGYVAAPWDEPHQRPSAGLAPDFWRQWWMLVHQRPWGQDQMAMVFLGQRQWSSTGQMVLVTVELTFWLPRARAVQGDFAFAITLYDPLTGRRENDLGHGVGGALKRWTDVTRDIRFFAGQADALDPTHFTIGYEIDGRYGTIDGWIRGPGNTTAPRLYPGDNSFARLIPRDGPLTYRPEQKDDPAVLAAQALAEQHRPPARASQGAVPATK